jgi:hypothetical protein
VTTVTKRRFALNVIEVICDALFGILRDKARQPRASSP